MMNRLNLHTVVASTEYNKELVTHKAAESAVGILRELPRKQLENN